MFGTVQSSRRSAEVMPGLLPEAERLLTSWWPHHFGCPGAAFIKGAPPAPGSTSPKIRPHVVSRGAELHDSVKEQWVSPLLDNGELR
jgi:hypothetical protein